MSRVALTTLPPESASRKPVGVSFTCPALDRIAGHLHHVPEPDQTAARICVEIVRLCNHELRTAAEGRVPKESAVIMDRIEALFARLEAK